MKIVRCITIGNPYCAGQYKCQYRDNLIGRSFFSEDGTVIVTGIENYFWLLDLKKSNLELNLPRILDSWVLKIISKRKIQSRNSQLNRTKYSFLSIIYRGCTDKSNIELHKNLVTDDWHGGNELNWKLKKKVDIGGWRRWTGECQLEEVEGLHCR